MRMISFAGGEFTCMPSPARTFKWTYDDDFTTVAYPIADAPIRHSDGFD